MSERLRLRRRSGVRRGHAPMDGLITDAALLGKPGCHRRLRLGRTRARVSRWTRSRRGAEMPPRQARTGDPSVCSPTPTIDESSESGRGRIPRRALRSIDEFTAACSICSTARHQPMEPATQTSFAMCSDRAGLRMARDGTVRTIMNPDATAAGSRSVTKQDAQAGPCSRWHPSSVPGRSTRFAQPDPIDAGPPRF